MMQYTCLKDGIIHFKKEDSVFLTDWHFGVINAPQDPRLPLTAYIFVGENDQEKALSIIQVNIE